MRQLLVLRAVRVTELDVNVSVACRSASAPIAALKTRVKVNLKVITVCSTKIMIYVHVKVIVDVALVNKTKTRKGHMVESRLRITHANITCSTHGDGKVPGLRHAEVARLDGVDVPRDDDVDDAVEHEHAHHRQQRDVVIDAHRLRHVAPLHANTYRWRDEIKTAKDGVRARTMMLLERLVTD